MDSFLLISTNTNQHVLLEIPNIYFYPEMQNIRQTPG